MTILDRVARPTRAATRAICLRVIAVASLGVILDGCVDPAQVRAQQHAADEQQCAGYGFQPGTDAYANCMMKQSDRREDQARRDQDRLARLRQKALDRSGDDHYPICSAASPDTHLDTVGNFWYAEGCRAR
jgi:hypothetical protein